MRALTRPAGAAPRGTNVLLLAAVIAFVQSPRGASAEPPQWGPWQTVISDEAGSIKVRLRTGTFAYKGGEREIRWQIKNEYLRDVKFSCGLSFEKAAGAGLQDIGGKLKANAEDTSGGNWTIARRYLGPKDCRLEASAAPRQAARPEEAAEARCGSDQDPLTSYIVRKGRSLVQISAADAVEVGKGSNVCAATLDEVDALIKKNRADLEVTRRKARREIESSGEAIATSLKVIARANALKGRIEADVKAFDSSVSGLVGVLLKLNAKGAGEFLYKNLESLARKSVAGDWAPAAKGLQYAIKGESIPFRSIFVEETVKKVATEVLSAPLKVRYRNLNTDLSATTRQAQAQIEKELLRIDERTKLAAVTTKVLLAYDARLRAYRAKIE